MRARIKESILVLMKLFFQFMLRVLAAGLLAGCAWVPQKLSLAPQVRVPASNLGNGATVVVKVLDIRPTSRIGSRGIDARGAEITTQQNVAAILQQKIIQGLNQQGFKAAPSSEEPAQVLKVELRILQYTTAMDFWQGTIRAKAGIQAYLKAKERIYDQPYVAEREEHVVEAPGANTNERLINGAISDVLERLLTDEKLLKLLAG